MQSPPKMVRTGLAGLCLAGLGLWSQPSPPAPGTGTGGPTLESPEIRVEGRLPVTLPLLFQPFRSPSQASKVPRPLAPSARRKGPNLYSTFPPALGEYAEAVKPETGGLARVAVKVRVEGVGEVLMALDSGVSETLLSPELARKISLTPNGTREVWLLGAPAPVRAEEVLIPRMDLGPLILERVPAILVPDRAAVYDEVAGVLPLGILRRFGLAYDRKGRALTLHEPGTSPQAVLGPGASRVPLQWRGGLPLLGVEIPGRGPWFFLLDNASGTSYLAPGVREAWNLPMATSKYGIQHDQGYSGSWEAGVVEDLRIRLGGIPFLLRTVRTGPSPPPEIDRCAGVLGREVMDLFRWYLDPAGGAWFFRKEKSSKP